LNSLTTCLQIFTLDLTLHLPITDVLSCWEDIFVGPQTAKPLLGTQTLPACRTEAHAQKAIQIPIHQGRKKSQSEVSLRSKIQFVTVSRYLLQEAKISRGLIQLRHVDRSPLCSSLCRPRSHCEESNVYSSVIRRNALDGCMTRSTG